MLKNTTRRLGAVFVALLVVCSFAGGPVIVAAAASGTVGDDVGSTFGSDDGSTDSSTSDDDGSSDDGSSDDSTDDSTDDSSSDDTSSDDTSSEDSTEDDTSEDTSEDDSTTDNVSDVVEDTVEETDDTIEETDDTVEDTADGVTSTGVYLVGSTTELAALDGTLSLTIDERGTYTASSSETSDERLSPRRESADSGTDADGLDADGTDGDEQVIAGAVSTYSTGSPSAGGSGGQPVPAGLGAGASLGLGAIAAAAAVRSTPLVAGSTSSSAGSAASGYLSMLLDKFKPFVFPFRYSRYDDSDPLEHEARELVYEIVNDTPGSYLSEVSEQAGLPLSTTRHHMKVLEREELVSGAKLRGKRRFYPAYAEGIELAAALNDDSTASIIDALSRLGASSVSDLAEDLGRDPSTISHHLQRLEQDEIITRERQGRAVVNKLSAEARTALEPETTPRPGEAAEALAD